MIDDLHSQFERVVSQERKIPLEKLEKYTTGRVFSGRQAADAGLIDMLGSFEDAVHLASQKAGYFETPEIVYPPEEKKGLMEILFGDIFQSSTIENLVMFPRPEFKLPY